MEKIMKKGNHLLIKAAALLLCALLLLAGVAFLSNDVAYAAEKETVNQSLIVSDSVVNRGAEFDVNIAIENNAKGMFAMRLFITYDNTAMTLTKDGVKAKNPEGGSNWRSCFKAKNTDVFGGYSLYGTEDDPFVVMWDSTEKMFGNGVILTLTFASSPDAEIGDYHINVEVSERDTIMTYGKICKPAVTGGNVEMLPGVYGIVLLNAEGEVYAQDDDNSIITIAGVLGDKEEPTKTDPYGRFEYTFQSWRDVSDYPEYNEFTDETHRYYAPTYSSTPIPYTLTFKQGIVLEGESEISYTDPMIQTLLGEEYVYDTETDSIPYGKIIVFDNYKPNNGAEYTFYGWYTDEACTMPVSYATMQVGDRTLYGVYRFNSDPDDITTTKINVHNVIDGEYLYATLSVTENFGFNTLRFALDYDSDALIFDGFLYESDSPFFGLFSVTFPVINDLIKEGGSVKDLWQTVGDGYSIDGKHFYFDSTMQNVYLSEKNTESGSGKLITFRFVIKSSAPAGDLSASVAVGKHDLTRFVTDDSTWYANAVVTTDSVKVIRVTKPVAMPETYRYIGSSQTFLFQGSEGGYPAADTLYYTVVNQTRTDKGFYNGDNAVKVTLKEVENAFVVWEDGTADPLTFDFVILKMQIAIPQKDNTVFVYDYNDQTYTVAESGYYTVSGATAKTAGKHEVTVSLQNTDNVEWTDGTIRQIKFDFVIAPKPITPPTATELTYTYNDGAQINYVFGSVGSSAEYTVKYNTRTEAGIYDSTQEIDEQDPTAVDRRAVKVALADEQNTVWDLENATEEEKVAPLYFTFTIAKKQIALPVAADVTYAYNGAEQTFLFTANGSSYPAASTDYYTVANAVFTNAGTYDLHEDGDYAAVKVALIDTANTEWALEAEEEEDLIAPYYFDFTVAKCVLTAPDLGDDYPFTGKLIVPTIDLAEDLPYEVYQNNGAISVGPHPVIFKIKDQDLVNYEWSEPDEDPAFLTVDFYITAGENMWTVTPFVAGKVFDGQPVSYSKAKAMFGNAVFTFRKGDTVLAVFTLEDIDPEGIPVEVGDYTLNVAVERTDDYGGLSNTINFSITPKPITIPTATTKTYVYSGEPQAYEFANYGDTELYTVWIGEEATGTMTNAGSKPVKVSLIDAHNYVWVGGSNGIIDIGNFVIQKAKVAPPTETVKTYVYTGNAQSYEFASVGDAMRYEIIGVDDSFDTDDNVQTRTRAGSQTLIVKLLDADNYEWDIENATEEEKSQNLEFVFTIQKKQLTIPVAAERSYIYNGEEQTFRFFLAGDTEQYTVWIGEEKTASKTEAGFYTVRVSINDPVNYIWAGNLSEDRTYPFEIRYAELEAEGASAIAVTVATETDKGFAATSRLLKAEATPDLAEIVAFIASAEKVGAFGALTDDEAAALIKNKCVVAVLALNLIAEDDMSDVSGYLYRVTLSSPRTGLAVVRIVDDKVEVFTSDATDDTLYFRSDEIGAICILADHVFDRDVVAEEYLLSPATCTAAAVYYKSCACGISGKEFGGKTFISGEALGHDYDFENILWIWSADHLSATARLTCKRDETHTLDLPATVVISDRVAPKKDDSGYADYTATFTYEDVPYETTYREILPSSGHTYSADPVWDWKETPDGYDVKAIFTCECGESVLSVDAALTLDVKADEITYNAKVLFEGKIYDSTRTIERPVAIFDFNDDTTREISVSMIPGESVDFKSDAEIDAPEREGYLFVGWQIERIDPTTGEPKKGALLVKGQDGEYPEYAIGFETLRFKALWRGNATVNIQLLDTVTNDPPLGAKLKLYENEELIASTPASSAGTAQFTGVAYGNYKMVVEFPYLIDILITRSVVLDVDESVMNVTVKLPHSNFNTVVEGVGSSENLDGAISDEEKSAISESTEPGTVNEVVITQKRVEDVADEIKQEILAQFLLDGFFEKGVFVDFYDITMVKTTTARNALGVQYVKEEIIKVADSFQTNIFPLSEAVQAKLVEVDGTGDNLFVYKRHVKLNGEVTIYALPKVSEKEGKNANYECYFIKVVAGMEYLAIRQREYSVVAIGVSPEPILYSNQITLLSIDDTTFGDEAATPVIEAKYGKTNVQYTYSDKETGPFVTTAPTAAGTYYLRAYIPASNVYAAAEKIVSFRIERKVIARPTACADVFTYTGKEQVYAIQQNPAYTVTGDRRTDAGAYSVTVSLVDPLNTIWDSGLDGDLSFDFVINTKKLFDIGKITFEDGTFRFDGKKHSIFISGDLPEGVSVVYSGNEESDLGKFTVTASFLSSNPNYDVSETLTATMHIELNWVPILILIVVALVIIIVVIVIVEKMLKKLKKEQNAPSDQASDGDKNGSEEGANND